MFAAAVISIIISVLLYIYWCQTFSRYAKLLNKFPGPPLIPIFGNVWAYSLNTEKLFLQIRETTTAYSETFRGWACIIGSLQIVTADDTEIILSSGHHTYKSKFYTLFEQWLGTGLLTSSGLKWRCRRKMLTPAFHFNILNKYAEVFNDHSVHLVKKLKEECYKSMIDIKPLILHFTLSSICETAMGTKLDTSDEIHTNYIKSLHKVGAFIVKRSLSPWLFPSFIYKISPLNIKFNKEKKNLHKFTTKVIQTREKIFEENHADEFVGAADDISLGIKKRKLAMLDLLISIKRNSAQIDDEGIREEVDTFIFEGHDTTYVSICFALLLLAEHKNIQEKVIKEIDEIFGDSKRIPTPEDYHKMKYMKQCINETLRLYPSVPFIIRDLTEDIQLTHHLAPAGTVAFIHVYNVHRDPKVFSDPEKFDPDRFLPENVIKMPNYSFIPFSAGPRNCIGQKYAMLEMKSVICSILRNFQMEPVTKSKDLCWIVDLVLRTKGPINIKFIPRE